MVVFYVDFCEYWKCDVVVVFVECVDLCGVFWFLFVELVVWEVEYEEIVCCVLVV